jgi:hypothetical protein
MTVFGQCHPGNPSSQSWEMFLIFFKEDGFCTILLSRVITPKYVLSGIPHPMNLIRTYLHNDAVYEYFLI